MMIEPTDLGGPPAPDIRATTARYREPDSSFINPSALAGRPGRPWLYLGALLLAAAADFANFYQIIQYVMLATPTFLLLLLVAGVTGSVLFLAHITGVLVRTRVAHAQAPAPRVFIVAAALAWIALGLGGLYVRLSYVDDASTDPPPGVANQPSVALSPTTVPTARPAATQRLDSNERAAAAVLFTALYVGTGVVALVGGFVTHDPAQNALRGARRAHDRAIAKTAESARDHVLAQGAVSVAASRIETARVVAAWRDAQVRAAEAELKRHVRAQIEAGLQDPTITDAYTHLDRPDDPAPAGDQEED